METFTAGSLLGQNTAQHAPEFDNTKKLQITKFYAYMTLSNWF